MITEIKPTAKTYLITIDRDVMWEYYLHYKNTKPKARTFPFARKIIEKLWLDKAKTKPKMTKSGKSQAQKSRNRKFNEITKDDMMYKVISLNDLLPIDSMGYNNKKEKWGDLGKFLAKRYNMDGLEIENAMIEYIFYPETKAKSDLDNLIGASKILNDGLFVQSGMFIDDNHYHINPLLVSASYDKEHPRTEIRITQFEDVNLSKDEKVSIHVECWKNN